MCPSVIFFFAINSRKMSFWNLAGQEIESPFERQPIEKICGPEVSLFLQCHLRGYDETGEGEKGYYGK